MPSFLDDKTGIRPSPVQRWKTFLVFEKGQLPYAFERHPNPHSFDPMAKVLVIEADPFLSKFYTVKLKALKHEVDTVLNGNDALHKLKMRAYDGVLLDLILPYRDGYQILRDVKRLRKKLSVKVVSTELQQANDIKKAFELGASLYFIKNESQTYDIIESMHALLTKKPLPADHGITLRIPRKKSKKKTVSTPKSPKPKPKTPKAKKK